MRAVHMITARVYRTKHFWLCLALVLTVQCSPSVIYVDADGDAAAAATVAITAQFVRIHHVKCEYKIICAQTHGTHTHTAYGRIRSGVSFGEGLSDGATVLKY